MISVIRQSIVAQSLRRLRAQKIHPLFAGYLHLQQEAARSRRSSNLTPKFVDFFNRFFRVKDHPIGTPYIKPFTNQKAGEHNLWLNENVAGSYAQSSLRSGQPFSKVVQVADGQYSLKNDHAKLALKYLLYDKPVSVVDLSVFLFRDFGLSQQAPTVEGLIDIFAVEFGYASKHGAARGDAFDVLYRSTENLDDDVFESVTSEIDEINREPIRNGNKHRYLTERHVRQLSARDLLDDENTPGYGGPPLRRLRVKGLLSFGEEINFEFGRLNLLVGPNGSGKSNLIDCLRIIAGAPTDLQNVFAQSGFESWLFNGMNRQLGSGTLRITARIRDLTDEISHEIRLGPPNQSRAPIEEHITSVQTLAGQPLPYFVGSYRSAPMLSVAGGSRRRHKRELSAKDYNPFQSIVSQIRDIGQYPEITRLASLYSSFRIYSEWSFGRTSKLRDSALAGRTDAMLSESMDDLPVALNALAQTTTHEKIRKLLPELKEEYRDFVTRTLFGRVGLELVEVPFELLPIPASRLSDGTLRFLALAVILLQPDPPPLICLEEPELGMHPDMIRLVAQMIIDAATKTQLIVTTHSEHLLTALEDDFDALFAFDSGLNGSLVQRLSREDFHSWRADHALGDIWSSGELGGVRY